MVAFDRQSVTSYQCPSAQSEPASIKVGRTAIAANMKKKNVVGASSDLLSLRSAAKTKTF